MFLEDRAAGALERTGRDRQLRPYQFDFESLRF
jgi:hypothetical protein